MHIRRGIVVTVAFFYAIAIRNWRKLTNRCIICHRKITRRQFELYNRFPSFWCCRQCNKALLHGRMYGGAGHAMLRKRFNLRLSGSISRLFRFRRG